MTHADTILFYQKLKHQPGQNLKNKMNIKFVENRVSVLPVFYPLIWYFYTTYSKHFPD